MYTSEKLTTQDEENENKNAAQCVLDTAIRKQAKK
jgi:hypothetical protein